MRHRRSATESGSGLDCRERTVGDLPNERLCRERLSDFNLALRQERTRVLCAVGKATGVGYRFTDFPLRRQEGADFRALLLADTLPVCPCRHF